METFQKSVAIPSILYSSWKYSLIIQSLICFFPSMPFIWQADEFYCLNFSIIHWFLIFHYLVLPTPPFTLYSINHTLAHNPGERKIWPYCSVTKQTNKSQGFVCLLPQKPNSWGMYWCKMQKEKCFIQMLCHLGESRAPHLKAHLLLKTQTKPTHPQQVQNKKAVPRVSASF